MIPLAYLLVNRSIALGLTIAILCALSVLELLRITGHLKIAILAKYLKRKEEKKPTGSLFYVVAALITMLWFNKNVAIPSLFILSISDPLSSLAGRTLGKHPLFGKSIEGSLVFLISSLIILILFSVSVAIALPVAFLATLTELITPGYLDDNLTIPIVTALGLTLLGT